MRFIIIIIINIIIFIIIVIIIIKKSVYVREQHFFTGDLEKSVLPEANHP